ncbi:hypothetical protein RISK_006012 [Rhodopirellula islandica]|uniref:Uncharacterized protein n=1 Tax=Rhodopirellula islandica TaxID=595434 RepID=A0A0J1B5E1_RHOIS|nr:hypothetical protein RISK_006012 [Rhodopirellula islandica]
MYSTAYLLARSIETRFGLSASASATIACVVAKKLCHRQETRTNSQ